LKSSTKKTSKPTSYLAHKFGLPNWFTKYTKKNEPH